MKLALRPYQSEALTKTAEAEARGVRRQLGVAATGLGKTCVFSALARQRRQRTLVLAHRDELVNQAADKMRQWWPEARIGIVKAERNEVAADVVVASVQTLSRPKRLRQLMRPFSGESLLCPADPFGLVVCDEAHHATSASYRAILDGLRAGEQDGPLLLGVTATPDRGDGGGLSDVFDEIVWTYDMLWGIRSGYLCDLRGVRVELDSLDMSGVKVARGDYVAGETGRRLADAGAPAAIAQAWCEGVPMGDGRVELRGRRTLAFLPTVETSVATAAEFAARGVAVGHVDGGTPLEERRRIFADFSAGRIDVLTNCMVATEGYDNPRVDCVIVARPTRSRALYAQMVGRGTRVHPEKADCLVVDVVGASAEHSLVTVPSLFGLDRPEPIYQRGESLTVAIDAQEHEAVRLGKLRAEEADLFRQVRREGIAWVQVHHDGDDLRRYVRTLGRDQLGAPLPMVVLAQREAGDVWTAGLQWPDGAKRVLVAHVGLEMAQGVAEDYIREARPSLSLVTENARWRRQKPSAKAVAAAQKWRLAVDPSWDAGQLSDALDAHIARIKGRAVAKRA